ncbi:MAG: heme exporter protein CcmB [Fidelibacterota bacterium]
MILLKLIQKELQHEIRAKESVISMVVFGVSVILLFSFAFNATPAEFSRFLPGLMWMTFLFISILGLLRSFSAEKEMDAYAALLSSPVDRGNIYLGKLIAFWIFLLFAQIFTLPLFMLFLNLNISVHPLMFILLVFVTNWAISAVGIMISGMGLRTRMGEVLVPVIMFPLMSPVLIAATKITHTIVSGFSLAGTNYWMMILLTFAVVFSATGYLTFGAISEE